MNYTRKLIFSMGLPTLMVAGAGGTVVVGAVWLAGQARSTPGVQLAGQLEAGAWIVGTLTLLCVACCVAMTFWIRRAASVELGGDPAQARQILAAIAGGEIGVEVPRAPEGSVLHSVERLASFLKAAIGEIRGTALGIRTASSEIASGNQDLSSRTEKAASNLQRTASAMEQLSGTVHHSAASAGRANTLAVTAAGVAERGGEVVSQVVTTMDEIEQRSRQIADIIGVIDGIAFQTNILALNAAVEAARAGEHGRGFAVVAGEVRTLAQRSAAAAKEIKTLIEASVDKVQAGSRLVGDAGQTMSEIVASVKRVSSVIGEISAATSEQSQGIGHLNTSIVQLDQMTQQNAALVEQSAAAAESLKGQAQRLAQVVQTFR